MYIVYYKNFFNTDKGLVTVVLIMNWFCPLSPLDLKLQFIFHKLLIHNFFNRDLILFPLI